jgi:hypothetical protein
MQQLHSIIATEGTVTAELGLMPRKEKVMEFNGGGFSDFCRYRAMRITEAFGTDGEEHPCSLAWFSHIATCDVLPSEANYCHYWAQYG